MMPYRGCGRRVAVVMMFLSLAVWLSVFAPVAMSQTTSPQATPPVEEDVTPFHQLHIDDLGLDCSDCHVGSEDASPEEQFRLAVRPDHDTCSDCHDEVEEDEFIPLCQTCHTGGADKLATFPAGQTTLTTFSHAMHIDPKGRPNAQGIRQDCVFCHQHDVDQRVPKDPTHAQCGSCHGGEKALEPVLDPEGDNETCLGCHAMDKVDRPIMARIAGTPVAASPAQKATYGHPGGHSGPLWKTARGVPYRDIVPFPHHRHIQRRDGVAIDCVTCHQDVQQHRELGQPLAVPTMAACATCHDNASWVRQASLTKQCHVCHDVVRADMRPQLIDPVSKALAHTESFRRFHKHQAKLADSTCQYCHQDFVNAQVDACAGCHSAMAPRSHQALRFNEIVHGRHAAMNRQTCSTCHTSSFCISCHQVPPRSHIPLPQFRAGGHRRISQLNLRSCFVCHQFEPDCVECHNRSLR